MSENLLNAFLTATFPNSSVVVLVDKHPSFKVLKFGCDSHAKFMGMVEMAHVAGRVEFIQALKTIHDSKTDTDSGAGTPGEEL